MRSKDAQSLSIFRREGGSVRILDPLTSVATKPVFFSRAFTENWSHRSIQLLGKTRKKPLNPVVTLCVFEEAADGVVPKDLHPI